MSLDETSIARTDPARIFAALGDPTRLSLIDSLSSGDPRSISSLADGSSLSRQAITKHLKVLEGAGLVSSNRSGREALYAFRPNQVDAARNYLDAVSQQWDNALERLRTFVED